MGFSSEIGFSGLACGSGDLGSSSFASSSFSG